MRLSGQTCFELDERLVLDAGSCVGDSIVELLNSCGLALERMIGWLDEGRLQVLDADSVECSSQIGEYDRSEGGAFVGAEKTPDSQKRHKRACIEAAQTIDRAYRSIVLLWERSLEIDQPAASDLGVSIQMLKATLHCGEIKIMDSIREVEDREFIAEIVMQISQKISEGNQLATEVYAVALEKLC